MASGRSLNGCSPSQALGESRGVLSPRRGESGECELWRAEVCPAFEIPPPLLRGGLRQEKLGTGGYGGSAWGVQATRRFEGEGGCVLPVTFRKVFGVLLVWDLGEGTEEGVAAGSECQSARELWVLTPRLKRTTAYSAGQGRKSPSPPL